MLHVAECRRIGEGQVLVVVTLPLVEVAGEAVVRRVHADLTSYSCTLAQNGSNSGRAKERKPFRLGTGAGRMRMILAPRSTTQSSSWIASSTIGRVMTGVAKIGP